MKPHILSRLFRLFLLRFVVACAVCSIPAAAADPTPRAFDIPSGEAEVSLKAFAVQSGIEVLFSSQAVQGVRTRAVKGEYPSLDALRRMLAGTRLTFVEGDTTGAVTIIPERDGKQPGPDRSNSSAATTAEGAGESLRAQADGSGVVRGRVFDAGSGHPLPGAVIAVLGSDLSAVAERSGHFVLRQVRSGEQQIVARYLGFADQLVPIDVRAGDAQQIDVAMSAEGDVIALEALVIEGAREGQARAIQQQRAATNIVNLVSADAIGNFPDRNAAEALQRIAGVSLVRQRGEGRDVTIRGAASDLNSFTLDGVSILSNQVDGRTISMDVFAAEQLAGIEVVKAVTPDMDGDSIGGAVNLKSRSAFDTEGRMVSANAYLQYNDLSDKIGYRAGATFSDVFGANEDWGLSLSLSYNRRKGVEEFLQTDNWAEKTFGGVTGVIPNVVSMHWLTIDRERTGVSTALEHKVNTADRIHVRVSFNEFVENNDRPRFLYQTRDNFNATNPVSVADGRITEISLTGVRARRIVNPRTFTDRAASLSAGGHWERGDLTIEFDSWYSAGSNRQEAYQGQWQTGTNLPITFDFSTPYFFIATPDSTAENRDIHNPANYAHNQSQAQDRRVENDEYGAKLDLAWATAVADREVIFSGGIKTRMSDRSRDVFRETYNGIANNGTLGLSDERLAPLINVQDQLLGRYRFGPSVDPLFYRDYLRRNRDLFVFNEATSMFDSTVEDYAVEEDIHAAYLMADVGFGRLDLLAGARYEHTETKSRGTRTEAGLFVPTRESSSYGNLLPGLHARYRITEDLVARFSWNNTLARPRIDYLAPNFSVNRPTNPTAEDPVNVSGGNPDLRAIESMNWDASLEYYLSSIGLISVGVFRKDLDGPIYRSERTGVFEQLPARIVAYNNAGDARIEGVEFTYQQQLTFLPAPFDGLGVYANYTLVDSSVTITEPGRAGEVLPLFGQSDTLTNLALSYQKHGLTIRVSMNRRGDYLVGLGDPGLDIYAGRYVGFDLTASYRINERWTLHLEGNNLSNEPERSYVGRSGWGMEYGDTGRYFAIGASVRL